MIWICAGIYGGFMLGVKSISGMAFSFYDWEHLELIRRYVRYTTIASDFK